MPGSASPHAGVCCDRITESRGDRRVRLATSWPKTTSDGRWAPRRWLSWRSPTATSSVGSVVVGKAGIHLASRHPSQQGKCARNPGWFTANASSGVGRRLELYPAEVLRRHGLRPDPGVKARPSSALRCQHTSGWTRRGRFPQSTSPLCQTQRGLSEKQFGPGI